MCRSITPGPGLPGDAYVALRIVPSSARMSTVFVSACATCALSRIAISAALVMRGSYRSPRCRRASHAANRAARAANCRRFRNTGYVARRARALGYGISFAAIALRPAFVLTALPAIVAFALRTLDLTFETTEAA